MIHWGMKAADLVLHTPKLAQRNLLIVSLTQQHAAETHAPQMLNHTLLA